MLFSEQEQYRHSLEPKHEVMQEGKAEKGGMEMVTTKKLEKLSDNTVLYHSQLINSLLISDYP